MVVQIAAVLLGTVLGLVALLLAVPVDVRCRARFVEDASWAVRVRWLFGLVRFERSSGEDGPLADERPPHARAPGAETRSAEPRPRGVKERRRGVEPGRRRRGMAALVRRTIFWRRLLRLLVSLSKRIRVRRLDAAVRFGFDDPADTGVVFGWLSPALLALRSRVPGEWSLTPVFESAQLKGTFDGEIRVFPFRLVGPSIAFGVWIGWQSWKKTRRGTA